MILVTVKMSPFFWLLLLLWETGNNYQLTVGETGVAWNFKNSEENI